MEAGNLGVTIHSYCFLFSAGPVVQHTAKSIDGYFAEITEIAPLHHSALRTEI